MSAKKSSDGEPAKPQVIDLDPEDVIVERDAKSNAPEPDMENSSPPEETSFAEPTPQSIRSKRKAGYALPVAALIAGLFGGGWLYRDVLASYFPTNEVSELSARLATAEATIKSNSEKSVAFDQQIAVIKSDVQKLNQDTSASGQEITNLQRSSKDTSGRISGFESAVADAQKQLVDLKNNINTLGTVPNGGGQVDGTVIASLRQRLDAVEQELVALKSAKTALSPSQELTQALSGLRQKINSGAPFGQELAELKTLEPDLGIGAVLEAQATSGLANATTLAQELLRLAATLPTKEPEPQTDDSYSRWITESLSGLISIETIGETDWPSLAKQAADMAANGELQQAVEVIEKAEGTKPPQLVAWRDRAATRMTIEAELARLSEVVMQRIAEKG